MSYYIFAVSFNNKSFTLYWHSFKNKNISYRCGKLKVANWEENNLKLRFKYSFKYRFANIGIEFPPHILHITRDKTFVYSKCFGLRPFINCTCVEIIEISNTLTRTVIRKLIAHISNCKTHFQCLFVMTDNKRVE